MLIGIIDVGIANLGSLCGALYNGGWDTRLVHKPEEIDDCDKLIIPGVGSFNEGMKRLNATDLDEGIKHFAKRGNPLLGICLGMHLLADWGVEGGKVSGLGLISGNVVILNAKPNCPVPHIGWNSVSDTSHRIFKGIKNGIDFYFIHSYVFQPEQESDCIAMTDYGNDFCSAVAHDNVVGVQFHPEKSQRNGIRFLENFCSLEPNA